jgi:hypothetical protein
MLPVEAPPVPRDAYREEDVERHDSANVFNQLAATRSRHPDLSRRRQTEQPLPLVLLAEERGLKHARDSTLELPTAAGWVRPVNEVSRASRGRIDGAGRPAPKPFFSSSFLFSLALRFSTFDFQLPIPAR